MLSPLAKQTKVRAFIFKSLLLSSLLFAGLSANAQGPFPMFNNRTHSVEAQPFADLSQRIWDLMAAVAMAGIAPLTIIQHKHRAI